MPFHITYRYRITLRLAANAAVSHHFDDAQEAVDVVDQLHDPDGVITFQQTTVNQVHVPVRAIAYVEDTKVPMPNTGHVQLWQAPGLMEDGGLFLRDPETEEAWAVCPTAARQNPGDPWQGDRACFEVDAAALIAGEDVGLDDFSANPRPLTDLVHVATWYADGRGLQLVAVDDRGVWLGSDTARGFLGEGRVAEGLRRYAHPELVPNGQ